MADFLGRRRGDVADTFVLYLCHGYNPGETNLPKEDKDRRPGIPK
jgi:hypothetical protein